MDSPETSPIDEGITNLNAAVVAIDAAAESFRRADYVREDQRREAVGWLDDLQTGLQRTGTAFQRLMERSQARSPLAAIAGNGENGDGPTVIVHEQGQGPKG